VYRAVAVTVAVVCIMSFRLDVLADKNCNTILLPRSDG
jgi:hypothetical protein